jgi:fatty acid desaturase
MNTSIAPSSDMEAYAALRKQVESAGLFKKRPLFYSIYTTILLLGLGLCFSIIVLFPSSILIQTVNALLLAILFMQFGFLGHDIAHHQVFSSREKDRWIGSAVYALALGISLDNWSNGHYAHHDHTNQIGSDPDIDLPLVFTEEQLETRSTWYRTHVLPFQHLYFFGFMSLAYLNYILKSLPWNVATLKKPIRWYEWTLMAVHFGVLLAVVFTFLGFWLGAYFLVLAAVGGGAYAGFSFAPNHKGQDVLTKDEVVTYRTMIVSTRNINPSAFTNLALGGLNFQIEHHLFSDVPRPNLPKVQKLVKEFCVQESLPYDQTSFLGSVKEMYQALRHFAKTSKSLEKIHEPA